MKIVLSDDQDRGMFKENTPMGKAQKPNKNGKKKPAKTMKEKKQAKREKKKAKAGGSGIVAT
jgi:hypothetical protein